MKLVAFATCTLLALAGVANASLGSFSGSNGTDSVSVVFPVTGVLDANPDGTPPQFKFFFTEGSGYAAAIPGFSVNATTGAGSVDFDRLNFNYVEAQGKLELIDSVGANNRKIVITNVVAPPVSPTMQLGDIMLTSSSMATIFDAGMQLGSAIPVAVPEPSAFLFGGLVLGMVGAGRAVRNRFSKQGDE